MKRSRRTEILRWVLLLAWATICLAPFLWIVMVSLQPGSAAVFGSNPLSLKQWLSLDPRWENFLQALTLQPFGLFAWNTVKITLLGVLGDLVSSSLVAYGFARFEFRGKNILFVLVLATIMLPPQVTMVPQFLLFRSLGWVDTHRPLIVPSFCGSAFSIFLFRQYFMTLPRALDEAAMIDGASRFRIYQEVLMPLAKPVIATVAVFAFLARWNDFMGPLIYLSSAEKFTLSLALASFQGLYSTQWHLLMAATLVVMLPCIVLFFAAQRYFISGITLGGVKA